MAKTSGLIMLVIFKGKPKKSEAELPGKAAETAGKEAEFAGHLFSYPKKEEPYDMMNVVMV